MKAYRVANRYAKALFDLAIQKKLLSVVQTDLSLLKTDYDKVTEFRELMTSPVISKTVKQRTFDRLFNQRLHQLTVNFIRLLFEKNREDVLDDIIAAFYLLLDKHNGIMRGEVRSVTPLSDTQLKKLKARMDQVFGKDVRLAQQIDPSLLGGFVVKVGDRVFNASLTNQLASLRSRMVNA